MGVHHFYHPPGTAFAYGQTSSGKTFTMSGSEEEPGIIPLAVEDVFRTTKMTTDREFLIRVSYMEIYNEEINDLLTLGNQKLPIHESLERGFFVAGIREEIVNSAEQVFDLLKHGEERIAKTGAGGVRLKEGKHINKSLMILGNVINKLSESGRQITPNFKAMADDFVVKRPSSFRTVDSNLILESFDNTADEDLWMQLNKEISSKRHDSSETDCGFKREQLEALREKCTIMERECSLLREEKASLVEALSLSKQDNEHLSAQKEELSKELNTEKHKMKELKEEIRQFSLAFRQREGLLTSIYTKSKAIMESLNASEVSIPEVCDS
ncbi:hypothetical protein BHM03_00042794 [Ensete ventricosum]|nr:hypothetical protein BHM03_00042794 [Ensete ventricosum]